MNDESIDDGDSFTDITTEAGVASWAFGLSATAGDITGDGWPDLYVANDYSEPDFYYVNTQDGTFRKETDAAFRHTSNFSMGSDLADLEERLDWCRANDDDCRAIIANARAYVARFRGPVEDEINRGIISRYCRVPLISRLGKLLRPGGRGA